MRDPAKKALLLLLALAIACLPLQGFACEMDPGQDMDHAAMQMGSMDHSVMQMGGMDHSAMPMNHVDRTTQAGGADANCCDPQAAPASGDCSSFMHCGSCVATSSLISTLPQVAFLNLPVAAASIATGEIAPSHSSPPYHPPTFS